MPKRKFTDEDMEEVGWRIVDRMLATVRPQQAQDNPAERLRQAVDRFNILKKADRINKKI